MTLQDIRNELDSIGNALREAGELDCGLTDAGLLGAYLAEIDHAGQQLAALKRRITGEEPEDEAEPGTVSFVITEDDDDHVDFDVLTNGRQVHVEFYDRAGRPVEVGAWVLEENEARHLVAEVTSRLAMIDSQRKENPDNV